MPDLIPILDHPIGHKTIPAVSARELHERLGVKRDFSTWLQQYITKDDWRKDNDFSVFSLEGENPQGGRPAMDAALSIQMAEHIAMMTRTAKGREIREYFRQARDERDKRQPLSATRGDLLVQMAEAYRLQEQRLLAVEAAQQEDQRQRLEHQAALIASQSQAIEALQQSTRAETKADHALHGQEWVTLRQYACIHALEHQFPPSDQHAFGTWLSGYCLQNNIPIYEIRPADRAYAKENQYHAGTIALTLPSWLSRRHGQTNLIHFPEQGT